VGWCSGRRRDDPEPVEACGEELGPRCVSGQAQPAAPAVVGDTSGDREQPQAQSFGFPPSCGVVGEGEQLQPGGELEGQGHDGEPDPVLIEVVQWQVAQAAVFGDADAVLTPCPSAVAQFEVGELAVGRVGGEGGDRSCRHGR